MGTKGGKEELIMPCGPHPFPSQPPSAGQWIAATTHLHHTATALHPPTHHASLPAPREVNIVRSTAASQIISVP